MVEDALYAANPPDISATQIIARPPLQAYILKLLYKDLNKRTVEKVCMCIVFTGSCIIIIYWFRFYF